MFQLPLGLQIRPLVSPEAVFFFFTPAGSPVEQPGTTHRLLISAETLLEQ